MPKIYIEKPKKPACLEIQNIVLVILVILIFSLFFHPLFLFIFVTAMVVFYTYDIITYKKLPAGIFYRDGNTIYYHKKGGTKIKLEDVDKVEVSYDKKNNTYIKITYFIEEEIKKELIVKADNAKDIEMDLTKHIAKIQKKDNNKK